MNFTQKAMVWILGDPSGAFRIYINTLYIKNACRNAGLLYTIHDRELIAN